MPTHAIDDGEEEYDPHHECLFGKIASHARLVMILRELELLEAELLVTVIRSHSKSWQ